jgi:hypothetical protein
MNAELDRAPGQAPLAIVAVRGRAHGMSFHDEGYAGAPPSALISNHQSIFLHMKIYTQALEFIHFILDVCYILYKT